MRKPFITAPLLSALALSACTTIEGWFSNPNSAVVIQTTTTLAVGEAILSQSTPAAEAALATNIVSVTQKVQADLTGTVTLADLVALVQKEVVKLGNPQEVLAANTLLTFLAAELQGKVSVGSLKPADIVIVNQFAGWVVSAATPYVSLK